MADVLEVPSPSGVVEVPGETSALLELTSSTVQVLEVATPGPQGPRGIPGAAGTVFVQSSPSSTWVIPHTLGRPPVLLLLSVEGKRILADEYPSDTSLTVLFPFPVAGTAVLL